MSPNRIRSFTPARSAPSRRRPAVRGGAIGLVGCLVWLVALPSLAVDGVREINQVCAVQSGCFSGDTPGFPVTIDGSAGQSYRLVGDLVVPDENTDGITVSASDVGIDLNNFSIIQAACVGATANCTPTSGSGSGVRFASASVRGLSVRNGSVVGMGSHGVDASVQGEVRGVRARWNRARGVRARDDSIIADNMVIENGGIGIDAGADSTVSNNTSSSNVGDGIKTGPSCVVSGNTTRSNGGAGIFVGLASTVSNNTAVENTSIGIRVNLGTATIRGNSLYLNGSDGIFASNGSTVVENTSISNVGDGISAGNGCTVQRNTVRSNSGYGLDLAFDAAYRENVITSNTTGTVNGGVNLFSNSCNATTSCP